jgi:hypothetical protein
MNSTGAGAESLKLALRQLHAELSQAQDMDEGSRVLLREVLTDIERLLHEGAAPSTGAAPHRLEAAVVEFETDHPALAASVRQFIDLLGRAGL